VPQRPSGPESKDDELNDNSGRHPGGFVPRRTAAVIAAIAFAGLLAAACGGGGSHLSGSGASSNHSLAVVLDSYASCMRGHGVPNFYFTHLTAPPSAPPAEFVNVTGVWVPTGVDTKSPQFQSAAKACGVPVPPTG